MQVMVETPKRKRIPVRVRWLVMSIIILMVVMLFTMMFFAANMRVCGCVYPTPYPTLIP